MKTLADIKKIAVLGAGTMGPGIAQTYAMGGYQVTMWTRSENTRNKAIASLKEEPGLLLNDAVTIPGVEIPQIPIVKGDAKSVSIAAASIMAKVTRDHMMTAYDRIYPEYGFAKHKGYGTAAHIAALREYGPCPIHRRSFITKFVENDE